MPLLTVSNLAIRTPEKQLVEGVSFTVNKGETVALVGESGSGKTLTALSVMGLLPEGLSATADAMTFQAMGNALDLQTLPPAARRHLRGRVMSMVFQEPATALNPVLTCGYQVEEAFLIHTSFNHAKRRRHVLDLFAQVQLPDPERIYRSYPHQLSGGQRQRVMIAMALAHKPTLLVADEPTTALDVTVQAEILKLVKDLQRDIGMAMLWITHDFGVVKDIADRTVVMQHGHVVEEGATPKILTRPQHPYTKQLLKATVGLNHAPITRPGPLLEPILEARHLHHTYGGGGVWPFKRKGLHALNNVSLSLSPGRTLGVVGESGSGKSTLARALTRLIPVEKGGRVVLMGDDFLKLTGEALRKKRKNLQMVFQDPAAALNPKMRVGEAVAEGIRVHKLMPDDKIPGYVAKLFSDCGLPDDSAGRFPHQFSGGQKQRLCIARALALQPKVIICDEAVSALDVSVQAQILKLLQKLQADTGTSFIFISHDLRLVSHLADDVLVMHHGRVVEEGPTWQVFGKPQHAYTQRLLSAVLDTAPVSGTAPAASPGKPAKPAKTARRKA